MLHSATEMVLMIKGLSFALRFFSGKMGMDIETANIPGHFGKSSWKLFAEISGVPLVTI